MAPLLWVVIGAMVGWAIGELMQNSDFGLVGHITTGIIGASLSGYAFEMLNISITGSLLIAMIGAMALVFICRLGKFNSP